ncbi:MAG: AmmeMemoRadiSam system protein A [Acidobacteria bacterium]|nr:AmmeMemoRadiSam system protein A [Acidobacteriota bacterium]
MIDAADRATLLGLARRSIEAWLQGAPAPAVPTAAALSMPAGAFVTLHVHGDLRGCIGHVEADKPLVDVVRDCAVSAASADPRFPPLSSNELPALRIEISVLSAFEPVHTMEDIEIGRDGLIVEQGWRRGLLLPQVAPEWGWDVRAFVMHTCRKAGLPADAWPSRGATLTKFQAEVFGEAEEGRSS